MGELAVHIGAHRTGTSSLQKFLQKNQELLLKGGIQTVFPPATREIKIENIRLENERILISEENILGTMENNIWKQSLYPDAIKQLSRYSDMFRQADIVYLSVRNYVDWWNSVVAFFVKEQETLPAKSDLEKIAKSSRGWADVVRDVRRVAPKAQIVVREFNWQIDNPKQQLLKATNWPEIRETNSLRSVNNARAPLGSLLPAIMAHEGGGGFEQEDPIDPLAPFSKRQQHNLDAKYQDEISEIAKIDGVRILGSAEHARQSTGSRDMKAKPKERSTDSKPTQTCLLHIGKTGGTFLKALVSGAPKKNPNLFVGKHGDTLVSTAASFGQNRKLAFMFRDPESRFISGFNSRMRQGRPTYNVNWSAAEAQAFTFFATPNQLAEALYSDDEREKSAAYFAFSAIVHLKMNYTHYLFSSDLLRKEYAKGNVVVCCETQNLNRHREKILKELGLTQGSELRDATHADPSSDVATLTKQGRANLKRFWPKEYEIYDTCRELAKDLGFTG